MYVLIIFILILLIRFLKFSPDFMVGNMKYKYVFI